MRGPVLTILVWLHTQEKCLQWREPGDARRVVSPLSPKAQRKNVLCKVIGRARGCSGSFSVCFKENVSYSQLWKQDFVVGGVSEVHQIKRYTVDLNRKWALWILKKRIQSDNNQLLLYQDLFKSWASCGQTSGLLGLLDVTCWRVLILYASWFVRVGLGPFGSLMNSCPSHSFKTHTEKQIINKGMSCSERELLKYV